MSAICSSYSTLNIFHKWHCNKWGIWFFSYCDGKVQRTETKDPITGAEIGSWKCKFRRVHSVCSNFTHMLNQQLSTFSTDSFSLMFHIWICRNFEKEFTAELQSLAPILSNGSRAEPYLTHLAQLILGVGKDQWVADTLCKSW